VDGELLVGERRTVFKEFILLHAFGPAEDGVRIVKVHE